MLAVLVVLVGILISMFSSTSLNADQVLLHQEENTNALVFCKQDYIPPSDLPMISGPFVGRQRDVESVTPKLHSSSTHTINIHGPPAFGKSTLAIHIGYKLVAIGISVRYIDTLEHGQLQLAVSHTSASTDSKQTGLKKHSGQNERQGSNRYAYDLLNWAQNLQNDTVLILDNCDGILNSRLRDSFINLIKKLPSDKLKLIVTSQEQLVFLDGFESWPVSKLDAKASEELLEQIVHNISSSDVIALAASVGGCPLALKVIGMLVNISGEEFVPSLVEQLNNNPILTLDKVSDKNARFKVVMDTAFSYLDGNLQNTGRYLCFFPGSFDFKAALIVVKSYNENHIENLVRHSLLEQYFNAGERRYKMHKLIREYFRSKNGAEMYKQHFGKRFRLHYSDFFINYTRLHNLNETSEREEHLFSTEKHNIDFLIRSFQSLPWQDYSSIELSTLTLAISEKWIPLEVHVLEGFVERLTITEMKKVCRRFTSYDDCTRLYLDILDRIYTEKCFMPCNSNFGCVLKQIHKHFLLMINDNENACDLFSCESVEHVLLLITELSQYWKNNTLSTSTSVRHLYDDLLQAKQACLCTKFTAHLWQILFVYASLEALAYVFDFKHSFCSHLFERNDIILKITVKTFVTTTLRFFPTCLPLLSKDFCIYLFPEDAPLFMTNQAVLHHLFSPSYLISTYFFTSLCVFLVFLFVAEANSDVATILSGVFAITFGLVYCYFISIELGLLSSVSSFYVVIFVCCITTLASLAVMVALFIYIGVCIVYFSLL